MIAHLAHILDGSSRSIHQARFSNGEVISLYCQVTLINSCLTDLSAAIGQSIGHKMWPHLLLKVLKELPQDPAPVSGGPTAAGRARRPVVQHTGAPVSVQPTPSHWCPGKCLVKPIPPHHLLCLTNTPVLR